MDELNLVKNSDIQQMIHKTSLYVYLALFALLFTSCLLTKFWAKPRVAGAADVYDKRLNELDSRLERGE